MTLEEELQLKVDVILAFLRNTLAEFAEAAGLDVPDTTTNFQLIEELKRWIEEHR